MGMVRVMLALAVVFSHLPMASTKFLGGGLAVQAFFIVSGFYMALVLDGKYRDARLFYSNRLLRLAPTYAVMMLLGALALFGLNASATADQNLFRTLYSNPVSAIVLVIENIVVVGQDLLFWFTVDPNTGALAFDGHATPGESVIAWQGLLAPQSWSLSSELMFYALAPLLARLDWRWLAALAAASIGLRLAGHWLAVDYLLWQGRFFPTALFMFLFGMLGYRALPLVEKAPKALGWIATALLLGYIGFCGYLPIDPLMSRWLAYAVVALTTPFVFNAFKHNALDRWIGDLSYPVYLSQLIVIGVVLTYDAPYAMWVAIAATFAISALMVVAVEHPVDRWRQRRLQRAQQSGLSQAAPAPA